MGFAGHNGKKEARVVKRELGNTVISLPDTVGWVPVTEIANNALYAFYYIDETGI